MDRLITTAWRAFWVGLGASVVLVGQSVFFPAPHPPVAAPPAAAIVEPAPQKPAISQKRVYDHGLAAFRQS